MSRVFSLYSHISFYYVLSLSIFHFILQDLFAQNMLVETSAAPIYWGVLKHGVPIGLLDPLDAFGKIVCSPKMKHMEGQDL